MEYSCYTGKIPVDVKNNEFISLERKTPLKIYTVGFQAAKSIPEIPEWFFEKYIPRGEEYKILEPFAGSGTTILEGMKNGNSVYWIDNNPLSRLMCSCKTQKLNSNAIKNALKHIQKYVESKEGDVVVTMKFANIDLWFQKTVQEALTLLKEGISAIECEETRKILKLALSITVRKMSEMEDSMILAARRSNNRDFIEYCRDDVYRNFTQNVERIIDAYIEYEPILMRGGKGIEVGKDARCISQKDFFDAIVTSPPYINAMDYIWATKFELHWLDLVENDEERLNISSSEIGTERIPAREYKQLAHTNNEFLNRILEDIYYGVKYKASKGQNELRSRVVYQYFEDMRIHFESAYKALKDNGKYCFIIGDKSKICGVDIPVADMLRDIACEIGFEEVFRFNLLLKNRRLNIPRASFAGTIKYDTVIILEKRR